MKRFWTLLIVLGICGCSYGKHHVEMMMTPSGIFEDPLYVNYQRRSDELEGKYLRQEISYAEYVEQKRNLEDQYSGEAEKRKKIIEGF